MQQQLFNIAQALAKSGLNKGTSGNCSVRFQDGFLVTPSGMAVDDMMPSDMVKMTFDGIAEPDKKPSSEWRFHRDILQQRPEINVVIHTHSMFATTLACLHMVVPAFHYMIAIAGGDNIRCAPYALFGSQALSDHAIAALHERKACLLANHGMIALGRDLDDALAVAIEVENLCEQYWRILQIAGPDGVTLLTETQMQAVFQQFNGYGKWQIGQGGKSA
jgi:L-fuculose-phosphate aldolase